MSWYPSATGRPAAARPQAARSPSAAQAWPQGPVAAHGAPVRSAARPSGQQLLRHNNLAQLLRLLRDTPGLSRAQLAERSGLTRSTVSVLAQHLLDEGWLAEHPAESTGALGRRPTPLGLNGGRFALVGVELAPDVLRVVAVSVRGDLLHAEEQALRSREAQAACEQLGRLVAGVVQRLQSREGRRVLGVGLGLPGAVAPAQGLLLVAPNLGWRDVPVTDRLQAALEAAGAVDVPVLAQNEADVAALGEMEFGPRPTGSPLVYVSCGIGLGSGIVVDEQLFTGAQGAAGEIGHTTLRPGGRACSCGRQGCAEAYIGLRALAGCAPGAPPCQAVDQGALRERLARQDPPTTAAFAQAGHDLGVLLHNLWALVDPQLIVLGGQTVALGGDTFVGPARQALADAAARTGWRAPALRVARFGEHAVAIGGAALVLRSLLQVQAPAAGAGASAGPKMISRLVQAGR